MPTQGARRRGEAFDRRNRQVPVRQDVDVVRGAIATGFDRAGQGIATSVKHPAEDAGGFRYGGSPRRFRHLGSRHGPDERQGVCHRHVATTLRRWRFREFEAREDAAEIARFRETRGEPGSRIAVPWTGSSIQSDSPDPVRIGPEDARLPSAWRAPRQSAPSRSDEAPDSTCELRSPSARRRSLESRSRKNTPEKARVLAIRRAPSPHGFRGSCCGIGCWWSA